jgi:ornithine cyclodeaminase
VLLFEPKHGTLVALMDAASVTAIRTAAVSGVATRALARADAGDLALLGSGVQARSHLDAMHAVRRLRRIRVWSRHPANRESLAAWAGTRFGPAVEPCDTAEAAVTGADLICTVTSAKTPVLLGEWLRPGAHINAVGSSLPEARELDTDAVRRARLYVDRRESALNEAGDFLLPRAEGAITDAHLLGEIGEVLLESQPGRRAPDEITLFKSLGLAVEDVAAAHAVWQAAERANAGTVLELGGLRE